MVGRTVAADAVRSGGLTPLRSVQRRRQRQRFRLEADVIQTACKGQSQFKGYPQAHPLQLHQYSCIGTLTPRSSKTPTVTFRNVSRPPWDGL